jgi:hypothetical protein
MEGNRRAVVGGISQGPANVQVGFGFSCVARNGTVNAMPKGGGGGRGSSPGRTANDDRADSMNRETAAGQAAQANHDNQVRENRESEEEDED